MKESKPVVDPSPESKGPGSIAASQSVAHASIDSNRTNPPMSLPDSSPLKPAIPKEFGRYRIERELGKGAMGVVYLALDTQLDRQVALKIPKRSILEDTSALERFYREARTTSKIRHPNICAVYDVGSIDGIHYLTMAYIPGKPVSSFLGKSKLLSARRVAHLIRKIALALQEAHLQGVIHRDLKPSNIMLDNRGEPIVMDFGLACQMNTVENARLTQSGTILGTPAYMAPEQVRGEVDQIGPQSDIYALGVILYQFLTGELPFCGPMMMVFAQIISNEPKRPEEFGVEVDPALSAICQKMMAKKLDERFASMREVADALTEYLKLGSMTEQSVVTHFEGSVRRSESRGETTSIAAQFPARPRLRTETEIPLTPRTWQVPVSPGRLLGSLLGSLILLCGIFLIFNRPGGDQAKQISDSTQTVVPAATEEKTSETTSAQRDGTGVTAANGIAATPHSLIGRVYSGEISGYRAGSVLPNSTRPFTWTIVRHDKNDIEVDYMLDDIQERWRFKGHLIQEAGKNPTIVIRDIDLIDGESPLEESLTIIAELLESEKAIRATGQTTDGWRSTLEGTLVDQSVDKNRGNVVESTSRRKYSIYGGRWSVDGDELVQDDASVEFAHLNFGDKSWTDYDFQVDMMRVEGRLSASLCVRVDDPQFCLFALGHGDKSLAEIHTSNKDINGQFIWRGIAQVYQPLTNNTWRTAHARVRENHFQCWLENLEGSHQLFEFSDDSLSRGRVGLRTVKSAFRFKNLRVTDPVGVVLWEGLPDIR